MFIKNLDVKTADAFNDDNLKNAQLRNNVDDLTTNILNYKNANKSSKKKTAKKKISIKIVAKNIKFLFS